MSGMKKIEKREQASKQEIVLYLQVNKLIIIPPGGTWVTFAGNPHAPRGRRITPALAILGIEHLDIYYTSNVEYPWDVPVSYDMLETWEPAEVLDYLEQMSMTGGQNALVTLHTPYGQSVKVWECELRPISEALIADMLEADYLQLISFGSEKRQNSPVWDEMTRDMIGSLMLDGLSYNAAQAELILGGEQIETEFILPSHFYRAIGEYAAQFKED